MGVQLVVFSDRLRAGWLERIYAFTGGVTQDSFFFQVVPSSLGCGREGWHLSSLESAKRAVGVGGRVGLEGRDREGALVARQEDKNSVGPSIRPIWTR